MALPRYECVGALTLTQLHSLLAPLPLPVLLIRPPHPLPPRLCSLLFRFSARDTATSSAATSFGAGTRVHSPSGGDSPASLV
jgi:hypothetical protein